MGKKKQIKELTRQVEALCRGSVAGAIAPSAPVRDLVRDQLTAALVRACVAYEGGIFGDASCDLHMARQAAIDAVVKYETGVDPAAKGEQQIALGSGRVPLSDALEVAPPPARAVPAPMPGRYDLPAEVAGYGAAMHSLDMATKMNASKIISEACASVGDEPAPPSEPPAPAASAAAHHASPAHHATDAEPTPTVDDPLERRERATQTAAGARVWRRPRSALQHEEEELLTARNAASQRASRREDIRRAPPPDPLREEHHVALDGSAATIAVLPVPMLAASDHAAAAEGLGYELDEEYFHAAAVPSEFLNAPSVLQWGDYAPVSPMMAFMEMVKDGGAGERERRRAAAQKKHDDNEAMQNDLRDLRELKKLRLRLAAHAAQAPTAERQNGAVRHEPAVDDDNDPCGCE